MGSNTLPSGSSDWMGEKWPGTWRTMHQGISPLSLTYSPPKSTMKMTTILQGLYQGGSSLPWWKVEPPLPQSTEHSTNSPVTIGVLWPKLTTTAPWMSSVKHCPPKSTSLNRRCRWLIWSGPLARGGLRQHEQTNKSTTYNWAKQEPNTSRTRSGVTWHNKGCDIAMDVGVHSDEEGGITSLGHWSH